MEPYNDRDMISKTIWTSFFLGDYHPTNSGLDIPDPVEFTQDPKVKIQTSFLVLQLCQKS